VNHVFAVFAHRVGLELGEGDASTSIALEGVRSHLRILLDFVDRSSPVTMAPSEPMLSIAAAEILNRKKADYCSALNFLINQLILAGHLLDRGTQGELFARLLFTMARDVVVFSPSKKNKASPSKVQPITLSQLLEALHGMRWQDETYTRLCRIADSKHMNFTHFVQLEEDVKDLPSRFLRKAWERGWAFQCAHNQPVFDLIFVVYSGDLDAPWDDSKLGTFVVQMKLKTKPAESALVRALSGPTIDEKVQENEIVMFMDLGTDVRFMDERCDYIIDRAVCSRIRCRPSSSSYLSPDVERKQWCVNIRGHGYKQYPILEKYDCDLSLTLPPILSYTTAEYRDYAEEFEKELRPQCIL
jgi:hypothetical protein